MSSNFERFTPDAQQVFSRAQASADQQNHSAIGIEHMLVALLADETSAGGRAARAVGLDVALVDQYLSQNIKIPPRSPDEPLTLSDTVKQLLEDAVDEAQYLNAPLIGTEHLLISLIRQKDVVINRTMAYFGVSVAELHRQLVRYMTMSDANQPARHAEAEPTPPPESQSTTYHSFLSVAQTDLLRWLAADMDESRKAKTVTYINDLFAQKITEERAPLNLAEIEQMRQALLRLFDLTFDDDTGE
jgi:ATP-dependent Clp protease ATP-binding subunit ClpC